jgi:hypothetical protein
MWATCLGCPFGDVHGRLLLPRTPMDGSKTTWNHEYYEALEFFFWESQHLGKMKNPTSKYDTPEKVFTHLRTMEVTLNHLFNLFFMLLPKRLMNELFSDLFGTTINDNFFFSSQDTRTFVNSFGAVTQPDLFFMGKKTLLFIEMKVESKTSLEQFMKYLLLSIITDEHEGKRRRPLYLLYIGKYDFDHLFQEKFASVEEAKAALIKMSLPEKTKNGGRDMRPYHENIRKSAKNVRLSYRTYTDLYALLRTKLQEQHNETVTKLMEGMCNEMEMRGFTRSW